MSVVNTAAASPVYTGNGATTAFPFPFDAGSASEIVVLVNGVTVGGYSVSLNAGGNGGTVTFAAAPASGVSVVILSNPDFEQDISFENAGAFLPESHDEVADRAARRDIWLKAQHARFVRAPIGDQILELAAAADRAGTLPHFDDTGQAIDLLDAGAFVQLISGELQSYIGEITKGDPGGNVMATGLFTALSAMTIPAGTTVIRTTGYNSRGVGGAFYVEDAAVDAAYVTANPRTSVRDLAGRGFRLLVNGIADVTAFGALPDGVTDATTAIQAALDYLNANGGGILYLPVGTFKVTAYLTVYPKTLIRGTGKFSTIITSTHAGGGGANAGQNLRNGCCFVSSAPINSSTPVFIGIEDICIKNTNAANIGAGYYDTGGTYVHATSVRVLGFKYGNVLDQTELATLTRVSFESQNAGGGGLWLVQDAGLTAGAGVEYTNVIRVRDCQFNEGATTYCVIDDGGDTHLFDGCNFNGGICAARFAGTLSVTLRSCRSESSATDAVLLTDTAIGGTAVGGSFVSIEGGLYNAPVGYSAVKGVGAPGQLSLGGCVAFFGGGGTVPISGAINFSRMWLGLIANASIAAPDLLDSVADNITDTIKPTFSARLPFRYAGVPNVQVSYEAGDYGLIQAEDGAGSKPLKISAEPITLQYGAIDILQVNAIGVNLVVASNGYQVDGVTVVKQQQAAIADANASIGHSGAAPTMSEFNVVVDAYNDLAARFNTLLSRIRQHGLIAT